MRRLNLLRLRFNPLPILWEPDMPASHRHVGGQPPAPGLPPDHVEEPASCWEELWIDLGGEG